MVKESIKERRREEIMMKLEDPRWIGEDLAIFSSSPSDLQSLSSFLINTPILEVLNLQIRNSLPGSRGGLFIDISKRVLQFWALIGPLLSALEARDATCIRSDEGRIDSNEGRIDSDEGRVRCDEGRIRCLRIQ